MPSSAMSHNVCYALPHIDVSYWIEIERGDFDCTDIVGEFSVIDPAFLVGTYGTFLVSDRSLLYNYALRSCFVKFSEHLSSYLLDVPRSFSVLHSERFVGPNNQSVYDCRCYFDPLKGEPIHPVDFRLSLSVESVGDSKTERKQKK